MVEDRFSALHQLRLPSGQLEPLHGHDWQVRAVWKNAHLDPWGMVIDFDVAKAALRRVLERLHYFNLNQVEAFAGRNPTAEAVAKHVFEELRRTVEPKVRRVQVTEAPGCTAEYEE